MSTDPTQHPGGPGPGPGQPSEEELRAAYEAELSRVTSTDVMAQAAVSLLNVAARRLGPVGPGAEQDQAAAGERDIEQARDAIDAVRALIEILERRIPEELRSLREALAQLQMAYAREVGAPGAEAPRAPAPPSAEAPPAADRPDSQPPGASAPDAGPAESSGRLWVPGR